MTSIYTEADIPAIPKIRRLSLDAPNRWLAKGFSDLRQSPVVSIIYGLIFTIAGALIIWLGPRNPIFTLLMLSGFTLVGPLAAVGLYDMSQRLEEGKPKSLLHAISITRFNILKLIGFAVFLAAVFLLWVLVTTSIVHFFFGETVLVTESLGNFLNSTQSLSFVGVFLLSGLVLGLIASSISIITIPIMNRRRADILTAAVIILVLLVVWARLVSMVFGLFFDNNALVGGGWETLLGSENFLPFAITFVLSGFVLAAFVFSVSVVTIPFISHRQVGLMTAINTSVRVVLENPLVMIRWAATIAFLVIVGMGVFFIGLAVTLPLIGHASWHAYREIVEV